MTEDGTLVTTWTCTAPSFSLACFDVAPVAPLCAVVPDRGVLVPLPPVLDVLGAVPLEAVVAVVPTRASLPVEEPPPPQAASGTPASAMASIAAAVRLRVERPVWVIVPSLGLVV